MRKIKTTSFINSNLRTPILFILTFGFALSILLIILHNNSVYKQRHANELLADRYSKMIESNLKGNIDFLNLLAIELTEGNLSESAFQYKVSNYLKNHLEFINITWVDSNFTIKSVCPLKGNAHIIGLNIELPVPKRASRLAKKEKMPIYTQPFEAIQGESSFEVWSPVFSKKKFMGLFAAVYSSNDVINTWIQIEEYSNTYFSLLDTNGVVLVESPKRKLDANVIYTQQSLSSLNNGMKLQVKSEINSPFTPLIIVIVSFLCILILGIAYTLLQLKNTQVLLKKNEVLLLNQNRDLIIAKENAEKNKNYLNNIINNMGDPVFVKDDQSRILLTNDAFCSTIELSKDQLIGKTLAEEAPSEEQDISLRIDKEVIETGEENINVETFSVIGKQAKTISTRKSRYIDNNGKKHLIGVIRDITEQKKTEEKLFESNEQLNLALEGANAGLWSWNIKTGEDLLDERWCAILGYTKAEIKQHISTWEELIHPDDKNRITDVINKHFEDENNEFKEEYRMKCKNGDWKWIFAVGKIVKRDEDGEPAHMTGIILDIAEQKLAEDKIRIVEESLKNTFDISPSIISKANISKGYFIEVNQAVTKILGYTVEEFTTIPFMELIHPDDRHEAVDEISEQLTGKEVISFENRYLCKDGSYKWMSWHRTNANENGIVTAIGTDVHERKLAEQELTKYHENLEELVEERTIELKDKYSELERLNKLFVGRELRMVELKEKIKVLENK